MALPALVPPEYFIGNYRIVSRLASGGMGVVYKAFDVKLQRTVALKFLNESDLSDSDRERVLHEARAASALDHKNIAAIHAVEESPDGQLFIVMGFYEGENLAMRMSHAPLSREGTLNVVRQIAQGLAHAHSHNIIHRDIKPSNVILCPDGNAKIVDFGLARVVSENATQSIGVSGTLPYMSPEQVSGKQVDERTDIWSLGVVLYELLTQRHPFSEESPAATVAAITKAVPPAMDEVPLPLQMIVYRMLSKLPEDRYQSCQEVIREIDACGSFEGTTTTYVDANELKLRMRKAGTGRVRFGRRSKWLMGVAVILSAMLVSPPGRHWLSLGRLGAQSAAVNTTPAAYESYEKGVELLQHFYRPEAVNLALAELNRSVNADPKFALAYAAMARAYFYQYQLDQTATLLDETEKHAKMALALNDQLSDVHVILGRVFLSHGKDALAQSEIQRALELDPKSSDAYLALGDLYTAMGRPSDAQNSYEQGIALNPQSWDGYYRLGRFLIGQQRYEEAIAQYRQALAIVPDHVYARTNMAVALKELHRPQEAEAELKKALEYGKVYSAYGNLANLYFEQGRFAEAAQAGAQALELKKSNYMVWNNQGVYYEFTGEKAKADDAYSHALALLEQQVQMKPNDSTVQADLALRYLKQHHDTAKALTHIKTALALQPTNGKEPKDGRVLQIAGEVYYGLGDRQMGMKYIVESLKYGRTLEGFNLDPDMREMMSDPKTRGVFETAQARLRRSTKGAGT